MSVENLTTESHNAFHVYCNGIEISSSPYDFAFFLSNNSPREERYLGEIKMSPEHAKTFAHILLQNIASYEELFGEIPQLNAEKISRLKAEGKIVSAEDK